MPSIFNEAVDKSLNTTHISANYAQYEAARNAFFTLVINDLDNLLKPNYTGDPEAPDADRYSADVIEPAIRLNVTKCPIPSFSVATEHYRRGNDVVNFATVPTFTDGTIEVDDVVGLDTKSILYAWLYLAYNPNNRMGGRMQDYKKTATLCEYTQDYELIRSWDIEGIFITEITEGEFDRENDGKRKLSAKFVYDRAVMQLPDEED